jgi:Tfp pilus assembly protein PilF
MKQPPDHASTAAPTGRGRPGRQRWIAAAAVFLFAFVVYAPALGNEFVWDDVLLIVQSYDVRTLDMPTFKKLFTSHYWEVSEAHSGMYRPLTALSLHTDYQLYGQNPAGFHLTNILVNAGVCVLLLFVLLEMFGRFDLAVTGALFYAAFPMHVESVAWVSGRTDVYATFFMLASLWCYARWRGRGGAWLLTGSLGAFAAALLSKETAAVFPAVVAVAEMIGASHAPAPRRRAAAWAAIAGMCVITLAYLALRQHVLGTAVAFYPRVSSGVMGAVSFSFAILAHYAYKLLFPFRFDAVSDFLPSAAFFNVHTMVGLGLVALAVFLLIRLRRSRAFVFGMSVIALGLAPVLNIIPVNAVVAERFLYFPSVGYALLVALVVVALRARWRITTAGVFAALLVACAARTAARTLDWRDDRTLFEKTVQVSGDSARARAILATNLLESGETEEALREFTRATEVNPAYAGGWHGLARTEARLGRIDDALEHMEHAAELSPTDAYVINALGNLQFQARQYEAAAESYRRALALRPRHLHARFNLGLALYQMRDFEGVVREMTALENKDADFVNAWFFLAEAEYQLGNTEKAARDAAHFLSLYTTDDALASRARALAGQ